MGEGGAVVTVGRDRYATDYSERVIELLVARKGVERMPRYLRYREERAAKLNPLFSTIARENRSVSVLEPGCSAGHLSEAILAHPFVEHLVSFDPDSGMVEVCREKKSHFGLERWSVECATTPAFTSETFDIVLMSAMIEHVDPSIRESLVLACYNRLKPGGLLVVLESQNRHWPFEYHVIRLPIPYVHYLPPRWIWSLCRVFGRYNREWSFEEFANPNTGWWGTSLAELRPPGVRATEVSEAYGYGAHWYGAAWAGSGTRGRFKSVLFRFVAGLAAMFGASSTGLLPAVYAVFRKEEP